MIRVESLSRRWGDFELRDISLSLETGEYCAVVGPCGAGKTLLLEALVGLHPPHEGKVWIAERDVSALSPEARQLGYVPQRASVFPHMCVRDNIGYGLRYHGVRGRAAQQRIDEAIEMLALGAIAARRDPSSLSGGEAQKVVLARALAVRPQALLLDEPLGSLDYQASQEVSSALTEICGTLRVTVIHVTHDYTEAASLADTVAVMRDGALVQVGPVEEVFWRPNSHFVAQFVGIDNVLPAEPRGDRHVVVGNMRWQRSGDVLVADDKQPPTGMSAPLVKAVADGPQYATVRPQDIVVGEDAQGLANEFRAEVVAVSDEGFSLRAVFRPDGPDLVASLPKRPHCSCGLTVGETVTVGFDAEAVHVFSADEE